MGETYSRTLAPYDWAISLALAVSALWLRRKGLDPSSLWLDDAWPALVHRADSLADTSLVAVTAPGFTFGLKAWLAVTGFSELHAQLPALFFGLATPPATYLLARLRGFSVAGAVVAGTLLVVSTTFGVYSTRVKQYTLDASLAVGVLAAAWVILDIGPTTRRWAVLLAAAVAATAVSGAAAPIVVGAFCATLASAAFHHRAGWKAGLVSAGVYGLFGLAWWRLVLDPAITDALTDYWRGFYVSAVDFRSFGVSLGTALDRLAEGFSFVPPWLTLSALATALAILAYRRWVLAVLLAGPVLVAIVLATLRFAPLGTGRTDIYLYPGISLLAAAAAEGIHGRFPRTTNFMVLVGVVPLLALAPGVRFYPGEDVRPLVEEVESRDTSDPVVVYSATRWAYALYTSNTVSIIPSGSTANGFDVDFRSGQVVVLGPHRAEPERYEPELERVTEGRRAVWFLASHWRDDLETIEMQFAQLGFVDAQRFERRGALLVRWERNASP